ncbi:ABC-type sugar transport system periplasmic component-like protein [Alkaliphilus metalliredigens QYMF]|uniref:ABC-type sugar transport system periplasmic component-like protein n=1 Tax=Alkaliphilus metalliredigens (strain QYMF) TaxID=293826 RepID=A6TKG6_ALKMQ|nr:substrate-binding domain-containing protein [Alkaliphilus metalliredigens]ABR46684.1 ABC-type sugar transport system periplasmic component-like protein [Alkaliphilus metalliredigens QYMF]
MKKIRIMLLMLILVVLIVGCGQQDTGTGVEDGKVLGVVMPNATHGFLGESIQHAEAATKLYAEEYGFEYQFLTSAESSEQNNQLDTLINQNVDAIVLWPHNGDEVRSGAQNVMDAGIPLIVYDRLIDGFEPTMEVMGDNFTIGEETGEYLNQYFANELAAGEVHILEFKGDNSTVPQQRSDGLKRTAHENIVIVQEFSTGWQRATAQEQMETFLTASSVEEIEAIKAIFTHDDEVVLGVLDAIMDYNGPAQLDIRLATGVGGRRENLDTFKPIKEGYAIDQVTYLFSPTMVRDAVEYGAKILNGESFSGLYLIDTMKIDESNEVEFRGSDIYKIRYESDL